MAGRWNETMDDLSESSDSKSAQKMTAAQQKNQSNLSPM
jgi:hypothetical protein